MKKAFTLVEMLIVVVVLVTLMTMLFKLGAIGSDSKARNETVSRMQRLEFAISGYHAAFGTYPPVKLQGSRNIFLKVDEHGMQNLDGEENSDLWSWYKETGNHGLGEREEQRAWSQVKAACRSQPVACEFPFPDGYSELVEAASELMKERVRQNPEDFSEVMKSVFAEGFDDGVSANEGRFTPYRHLSDWRDVQLFRFGVLSYLLPRYMLMMNGKRMFFERNPSYAQWNGNNALPSDPLTGLPYADWTQVQDYALRDTDADLAHVANIPSQAACARWMPTFEKSLCCNHAFKFFGVDVKDDSESQASPLRSGNFGGDGLEVHSPGGYARSSTANQYVLDIVTMKDGWGQDLFYYSPPPYQSYMIWSSGANKRTFPPWISRKGLTGNANKCIAVWIEDDIMSMSK